MKNDKYEVAQQMRDEMDGTNNRYVPCKLCNSGQYGGIFMLCCDNPACELYSSFSMARCGICGVVRRNCCC